MTEFITLDANQERALADRKLFAEMSAKSPLERANSRKEIAAGDGDFTRVSLSEGQFIDLAIHKDTFLDDAALRSDVSAETPIAWKTRYQPVVGVTTGSIYGGGIRTLYQTQDNAEFLTPFVVDVENVMVPTMALTQNVAKLGQRDAALARQAEALRLKMETFLVNFMTGQPIGTDLATSITNYCNVVNPYGNKTVYVVDPGVQSGTYETSNIVDASAQAGITPTTFELLLAQEELSGRRVRTIHIPKAGLPWRRFMRYATIVANASSFGAGAASNPNLAGVPMDQFSKNFNMDLSKVLEGGLIIEMWGRQYKIKANNALPQGYCICTTDQPAAEIFNVTDRSISYDLENKAEPYFQEHGEKRMMAVAVPDPWQRNWFALKIGNTNLTQ
jgi:hypothetical protein